jgi:hypothetical protein
MHPSPIGLAHAPNLKQLSFLPMGADSALPDFLNWLIKELTWKPNQARSLNHPSPSSSPYRPPASSSSSTLEHFTLCVSFDGELDASTYARTLSDVLADERHYPNLKQVRLPVSTRLIQWEGEQIYKDKISRAMQALDDKGILQLQWPKEMIFCARCLEWTG